MVDKEILPDHLERAWQEDFRTGSGTFSVRGISPIAQYSPEITLPGT